MVEAAVLRCLTSGSAEPKTSQTGLFYIWSPHRVLMLITLRGAGRTKISICLQSGNILFLVHCVSVTQQQSVLLVYHRKHFPLIFLVNNFILLIGLLMCSAASMQLGCLCVLGRNVLKRLLSCECYRTEYLHLESWITGLNCCMYRLLK